MQQHCRSLDQERNRRAHSLNFKTAPAASAAAAGDASGAYYLFCFILLSREGKIGFASCTFILMWCSSMLRLHSIVVDRCFLERLCTDAPAPPAAGAKEFRLRRVGRNTLSAIMRLGKGQRKHDYTYFSVLKREGNIFLISTSCQCAQARPHRLPWKSAQVLRLLRPQVVVRGPALRFLSVHIFQNDF